MARKQVDIGTLVGFHIFDDVNGDVGLSTDAPIRTSNLPTDNDDVLRLSDLTSLTLDDLSDVTIDGTPADNEVLAFDTGSGEWINQTAGEAGIAAAVHTHVEADITDLDKYTQAEVDALTWDASDIVSGTFVDALVAESNITQHEAAIDHDALTNFVANEHIDWTNATSKITTTLGAQFGDAVLLATTDAGKRIGVGPSITENIHLVFDTINNVGSLYTHGHADDIRIGNNWIRCDTSGNVGFGKQPASKIDIDLATEDLEIVDAGSIGATEQDWIEVEVGGVQGYIRVYASK